MKTNLQLEVPVTSKLISMLLCVLEYFVWREVREVAEGAQDATAGRLRDRGHGLVGLQRRPAARAQGLPRCSTFTGF